MDRGAAHHPHVLRSGHLDCQKHLSSDSAVFLREIDVESLLFMFF